MAFEGQDGAGKTSLLAAVHRELARAGVDSLVVEEFSDSPYGRRLVEAVGRDKFLRPVPGEQATVFTRACEEVADRILHQLMNEGYGRRLIVDNATRPHEQVAQEVAQSVLQRLPARGDSISTVRSGQ